jgi:hypothetical protein
LSSLNAHACEQVHHAGTVAAAAVAGIRRTDHDVGPTVARDVADDRGVRGPTSRVARLWFEPEDPGLPAGDRSREHEPVGVGVPLGGRHHVGVAIACDVSSRHPVAEAAALDERCRCEDAGGPQEAGAAALEHEDRARPGDAAHHEAIGAYDEVATRPAGHVADGDRRPEGVGVGERGGDQSLRDAVDERHGTGARLVAVHEDLTRLRGLARGRRELRHRQFGAPVAIDVTERHRPPEMRERPVGSRSRAARERDRRPVDRAVRSNDAHEQRRRGRARVTDEHVGDAVAVDLPIDPVLLPAAVPSTASGICMMTGDAVTG